MDSELVQAVAIGLLTFGALYLSLDIVFPDADMSARKVKAIFAGAGFLLVAISLWRDPALLRETARRMTWELIAVVFALLLALRMALRRR
jgi:hypothetical protein